MEKKALMTMDPKDGLLLTSLYKDDHHIRNESKKLLKVEVTIKVLEVLNVSIIELPYKEFMEKLGELTPPAGMGKIPIFTDEEIEKLEHS